MRNAKISRKYFRKMQKFHENIFWGKNFREYHISVIAATINCAKIIVEFSALRAQYLKLYYVILIISLPFLLK